ncbi:amidohydrolase [Pseudonocardia sp. RS11V-5]|uniref:amidohydrolase family protein n=1 Tax=Pseudonocardia terrae TaxID=2905831 RepID=UPI001E43E98A|nr:amidohydrolase family protein [Pseudonocardia terrae]MCE3551399.1 amidohydrolase [Pseudonocardia terrae]
MMTAAELPVRDRSRSVLQTGIVDADVHNMYPAPGALVPYLSQRWARHLETIGLRTTVPYRDNATTFFKLAPAISRRDAWPPGGGLPGSDLAFLREQLLDGVNVRWGVLNFLTSLEDQLNEEWAAAMARAMNDWQIAEWLDPEPRLRASIVVQAQNPELAVAEIERLGGHPGFVQVLMPNRTAEPLGRRKHWPIFEAAERHGLTIGMHTNDSWRIPPNSGWYSYYLEDHTLLSGTTQSQLASLVLGGVFERFPGLRVVCIEGGFAWMPALMQRLDAVWRRLGDEIPDVVRPPSEYLREQVWVTTQPMEEPARPRQLLDVIEQMGADRIMFATDYPHWDSDDPVHAFPLKLPHDIETMIFRDNAARLYGFPIEEDTGV